MTTPEEREAIAELVAAKLAEKGHGGCPLSSDDQTRVKGILRVNKVVGLGIGIVIASALTAIGYRVVEWFVAHVRFGG